MIRNWEKTKYEELVRNKGYKLTSSRKHILSVLTNSPLNADEIYKSLNKNKKQVDLATIYRNLAILKNVGIVKEVILKDRVSRYELQNSSKHHHHVTCDRCGISEDVDFDESWIMSINKKSRNIKVTDHQIEFFGKCLQCQE